MDEKVKSIQKRREEEDRKFFKSQKVAEKIRLQKEEDGQAKLKKNEEKKLKFEQNYQENLKERGITKLPSKYTSLVGDYNNLLKVPGDGSCQASSKAAILLQDPSLGPQLAIEENSLIVEHWEEVFSKYFVFPHTLTIGGGKTILSSLNL